MILEPGFILTTKSGFPRVSGDDPMWEELLSVISEFSPRERG